MPKNFHHTLALETLYQQARRHEATEQPLSQEKLGDILHQISTYLNSASLTAKITSQLFRIVACYRLPWEGLNVFMPMPGGGINLQHALIEALHKQASHFYAKELCDFFRAWHQLGNTWQQLAQMHLNDTRKQRVNLQHTLLNTLFEQLPYCKGEHLVDFLHSWYGFGQTLDGLSFANPYVGTITQLKPQLLQRLIETVPHLNPAYSTHLLSFWPYLHKQFNATDNDTVPLYKMLQQKIAQQIKRYLVVFNAKERKQLWGAWMKWGGDLPFFYPLLNEEDLSVLFKFLANNTLEGPLSFYTPEQFFIFTKAWSTLLHTMASRELKDPELNKLLSDLLNHIEKASYAALVSPQIPPSHWLSFIYPLSTINNAAKRLNDYPAEHPSSFDSIKKIALTGAYEKLSFFTASQLILCLKALVYFGYTWQDLDYRPYPSPTPRFKAALLLALHQQSYLLSTQQRMQALWAFIQLGLSLTKLQSIKINHQPIKLLDAIIAPIGSLSNVVETGLLPLFKQESFAVCTVEATSPEANRLIEAIKENLLPPLVAGYLTHVFAANGMVLNSSSIAQLITIFGAYQFINVCQCLYQLARKSASATEEVHRVFLQTCINLKKIDTVIEAYDQITADKAQTPALERLYISYWKTLEKTEHQKVTLSGLFKRAASNPAVNWEPPAASQVYPII